jgi:predicted permease
MLQDLRYGLRLLAKSPAFTVIAALSLGLGIGANTAIFSMVNVILLKPLPVSEPERIASVFMLDQRNPGNLPLSHLNFKDLRDQNRVFSGMAAIAFTQLNWSSGTESEQVPAQVVSGNYFSLLGAEPALGRGFVAAEDEERPIPVAVISHGFWERSLGGDAAIIGKTLTFNRTPFTVIGVARKGFTGTLLGAGPSVWVPMAMHDVAQPNFTWYGQRRGLFLFAIGRLAPRVSVEQASANVKTVFAQLEQAYPNENRGRSAGAVPMLQARLNPQGDGGAPIVQISVILMTVVGIVLLIACANIANLLLARANRRRREIAVRLALGANRVRLVRQLLTESTLLSLLGAGLGLALAHSVLAVLVRSDLPLPLPIDGELALDERVLAFTAALAVATGLLFGLAPALQAAKADVVPVLKTENVPAGSSRRGLAALLNLRQALVIVQIALSLISLVAAGLFLRSLRGFQSEDPGFETRGVLVMNFNLGREGYTPARGQIFYEQIAERAAALPGVQRSAVAQSAPFAGGPLRSVMPEGADTTTTDRILVQVNAVSPGYLDALNIPLRRGRDFAGTDVEGTPKVVIVNEIMAARFWPGQDAIGKRFKFFGDDDFTTVVGVARDAKYNAVGEDPTPFIYQPLRQSYSPAAVLHVRAGANAASLADAVRREVRQLDPTLSVFNIRTLDDQVADSLAPVRTNVILLSGFGALALLLAAIGLYGVANYSVAQRTREIGVRMALGARSGAVLRLVLGHGLLLVAIGLALGMVAAFGMTWAIPPDLLPNVSVRDPVTFAAPSAILGAVALIASYVPAWRATRIDPLVALRTE